MKLTSTLLILFISYLGHGQIISDFEDITIPAESYLNGAEANGVFRSAGIHYFNEYFPEYDSWTGWAISNTTDIETIDYSNQYSAITGTGFSSENYAVSYSRSFVSFGGATADLGGVYVTNSTFTYHTLLNGDSFSKKFGGASGNDPDYFIVNFVGFKNGEVQPDTVRFYLADYRFENNDNDYIVDDWQWVDLSILTNVDSIQISYESSDVGQFGINTPTYACFDNFEVVGLIDHVANVENDLITVFPNPTSDYINIHSSVKDGNYTLSTLDGQLISDGEYKGGRIDLTHIERGNYIFSIESKGVKSSKVITKL